ncbi:TlpA disulfide reductase family protein [Actinocorallia longicatena]|uniref:Thioredoxin domain-containing protein n=1 Tax=Actinocorallia longicatena TaxID=111803 RepID=A0ABP6QKA9_9ACTN
MNPRVAIAVAAVAGLSAAGCSANASDTPAGKVIPAADRGGAVSAQGTGLDDKPLDLADHRGEIVVVNFWGSWCEPCRTEAPVLEAAAKKYTGVRFLGVDSKDTKDGGRAFLRTFKLSYPSFFDPEAKIAAAFKTVNPNSLPATLILDRQGRVAVNLPGQLSAARIEPVLDQMVAEK